MENYTIPQNIIDVLEENEWTVNVYPQDGEYFAEIEAYSPAGEDFLFNVWFNGLPSDFIEKVCEYDEEYDPDDHAAELVEYRGRNGVPDSIRDIIDDAEAIGDMLNDLSDRLAAIIDDVSAFDEEYVRQNWEDVLGSAINYADISHAIGWGFTNEDLHTLMELHKAGKYREKIEDLLTDCNFHSECAAWSEGDYTIKEG